VGADEEGTLDSFIIVQDSLVLAERAAREVFMLAPGAVFHLRARHLALAAVERRILL
jgi:hypothetical protein